MKKLIFLFTFFPILVWADEIQISLTPTNTSNPTNGLKVSRIVIDPGNGGKDSGTIGYDKKLLEKDINLKISKKIVDLLKRKSGLVALLTRQGDNDVSDKERVDFANSRKVNLFVSIHCNQSEYDKESGTVIYRRGSKVAEKPVGKISENGSTTSLDDTLIDLKRSFNKTRSSALAEQIEQQIVDRVKQKFLNIRQAPFYVLENVDAPSIWIGMAYITNKEEEIKLGDFKWQDQMAEAIENGILKYKTQIDDTFQTPQPTETDVEIELKH